VTDIEYIIINYQMDRSRVPNHGNSIASEIQKDADNVELNERIHGSIGIPMELSTVELSIGAIVA
jgi:hypothetical protein